MPVDDGDSKRGSLLAVSFHTEESQGLTGHPVGKRGDEGDLMKTSLRALALTSLLAGVVVSLAVPAYAQVSIQFRLATRERPLQRRQFDTITALAHYLTYTPHHPS